MNRFLFVVVLYRTNISDAPAMRSLSRHRALLDAKEIRLLVIDNTPEAKPVSKALDSVIKYEAFGENKGLAGAYSTALLRAKEYGCTYLVLVDQDSEIEDNFIRSLDEVVQTSGPSAGIWCPNVVSCGRRISPYSLNIFGFPRFDEPDHSGRLYGINSFSVVKISCLDEIGGFSQFYWLDCLDFWLYETAQQNGWKVNRLAISVKHDLSLVSGKISAARMKNIAFYESCFVLEHGSYARVLGGILKLIGRGLILSKKMGGIAGLGSYLVEIFKGVGAGIQRRRMNNGHRKKSKATSTRDAERK